jgi:shikimate dehydrogenase
MGIDRYAVIGHHIGYSRSPQIHALFAQQTGQALAYGLIDVAPAAFARAVREFLSGGGRGLNVTVPHKQAAMQLADTLSARAQRAGALNTLALCADGRVLGENTDGAGLLRDLTVNLGVALRGARVLLLGAGGAARGVLAPLLEAQPAALVIYNRDVERAQQLAAQFADLGAVHAHSVDGASYDLIINATSADAQGQLPALPAQPSPCVGARTLCYDLAYSDVATPFQRWARAQGAGRTASGLGMLVEQAAESFLLWRGVRPETAPVLALLGAPPTEAT